MFSKLQKLKRKDNRSCCTGFISQCSRNRLKLIVSFLTEFVFFNCCCALLRSAPIGSHRHHHSFFFLQTGSPLPVLSACGARFFSGPVAFLISFFAFVDPVSLFIFPLCMVRFPFFCVFVGRFSSLCGLLQPALDVFGDLK